MHAYTETTFCDYMYMQRPFQTCFAKLKIAKANDNAVAETIAPIAMHVTSVKASYSLKVP